MRRFAAAFAAALAFAALSIAPAPAADTVFVFGAASVTDVMQQAASVYEAAGGDKITFSFAASSALAKQIESSGGADMFISADIDWMDYLDKKGLIQSATRKNLLGNRLVLVAPAESMAAIDMSKIATALPAALGGKRLALADPDSVPAGKYGKAALTKLGVWDTISGQIAPAENVRVALAYVARGEAPFGIVYETDAKAEPKVKVIAAFPEDTHPAILYPFALTKDAKPAAAKFLTYLEGPAAKTIFEKAGFTVLP